MSASNDRSSIRELIALMGRRIDVQLTNDHQTILALTSDNERLVGENAKLRLQQGIDGDSLRRGAELADRLVEEVSRLKNGALHPEHARFLKRESLVRAAVRTVSCEPEEVEILDVRDAVVRLRNWERENE